MLSSVLLILLLILLLIDKLLTWAILNLSNMVDTQELNRLALVPNLMDRSSSMSDTDDCIADLRHLNQYHVYIDENKFYMYFCALQKSEINFKTS